MTFDPLGTSSLSHERIDPVNPQPPTAEMAPTDVPRPQPGADSASRSIGRYQLGASDDGGHYAARDRFLDRQVTARLVSLAQADDLEREARFIARLDHAGVPGVLDFLRSDTGAMLILRRVDGITLTEGIARAVAGNPPPELTSTFGVIQVILQVCEALGAAHARGVVHRKIVTDNILLGWQGQVVVQDWSQAMEENIRPLTVRFVGGSTHTATSVLDGLHQDVRGVGMCLLSALICRQPSVDAAGTIAGLSSDEVRCIPPRLMAIIKCALVTDASTGYASMSGLSSDLESYLEGREPVAYRPGPLRRSTRWVMTHRRTAASLVFFLAVIGAMAYPMIRDQWAWGEPILVETFSESGYKARWKEPSFSGMFRVENGRLVSIAPRNAELIYPRRLTTPLAIEYSAEILPGSRPCDLSVSWRENPISDDGSVVISKGGRRYGMQFGGLDNAGCMITLSSQLPLAFTEERLEVGRKYRFRVEIGGGRISMLMDGRMLLQYEDPCPLSSGYIGLYAHYPGKAFDDLRLFQKKPIDDLSPLCLGDALLSNHQYGQAEAMYASVAAAYVDRPEGQRAQLRKGWSEWLLGCWPKARVTWAGLTDPECQWQSEFYAVQGGTSAQQERFCSVFKDKFHSQPALRPALLDAWCGLMRRLAVNQASDPILVDRLLRLRNDLFNENKMSGYIAGRTILAHQRYEDCISLFPNDAFVHGAALLALGRTQEVIDAKWVICDTRNKAMQMRGDYQSVIDDPDVIPSWRAMALCMMGRAAEAPTDPELRYPVLLHLDRSEELLGMQGLSPIAMNETLINLGRLTEAAGGGIPEFPGSGNDSTAQLLLGDIDAAERGGTVPQHAFRFMMAVERGDDEAVDRLRPLVSMPRDLRDASGWFTAAIVKPLVAFWRGDTKALETQLRPNLALLSGINGKRSWFIARAMLGEAPPDSLLSLPASAEAPAWRHLTEGICSELAGMPQKATSAYRDFTALPITRRQLSRNVPDAEVEWFVRWRLRALGR